MNPALLVVAGLVVAAGAMAAGIASHRFSIRIERLRRSLRDTGVQAQEGLPDLPPLVRAFAERNGGRRDGPHVVRMIQTVEMRLKPGADLFPLTAIQDSGTRAPGFVWDARGRMAGVLPIRILDSYVAGTGLLEVRVAGGIRVARATGSHIDKGEAMRFLAELPWNPDAILSASALEWAPIDARTVEVSMQTTGGPARVRLAFDAGGDIASVSARDRPREVAGSSVPAEWIGRFSGYVSAGGYRWPGTAEVAWVLPEGEFVYWRGRIISLGASPD